MDSSQTVTKKEFDIVSIITEIAVVTLIIAFVLGKITKEDLTNLITIINQ